MTKTPEQELSDKILFETGDCERSLDALFTPSEARWVFLEFCLVLGGPAALVLLFSYWMRGWQ